MTSPASGSDIPGFDRLHLTMQRWIHQQGWTSLHDAQERAIKPILDGQLDVIISAATAAGKTEAAFLPICSVLAASREQQPPEVIESGGVEVLYLSPLKALINDQYDRLDYLCEVAGIPVHRWHGDVAASVKGKVLRQPEGVLLITPESLEALFVNRGPQLRPVLAGLRYVVVDELHSFLATARGAQLQSLMGRVELTLRRRVPRIGLSATLGDLGGAAAFLRPSAPESVELIVSDSDRREVRLQLRGYKSVQPDRAALVAGPAIDAEGSAAVDGPNSVDVPTAAIGDHLYRTLRGADNLVFATSRRSVELFADYLSHRCESEHQPNEFWPHHGSLSKDMRESVERDLKDPSRPATAICTSTLEMGIDIGTIDSVAQIDPPPSVASLRQRLGRSGRRHDAPSTIRLYVTETELDERTTTVDDLRCALVQTVAMIRLMLEGWVEAPADPGLNLSTLIQQTLSLIAQHGGASAADLHGALCGPGPFGLVDRAQFARLLRAMSARGLLVQASDGTLLHGPEGERAVNHYSFYAAFATVQEWRLVADGKPLGTLPIGHPILDGDLLIFSGRRWEIVSIEPRSRVVELRPARGGRPPRFGGSGHWGCSDRVRAEMVRVYRDTEVPPWLDFQAAELLAEGRRGWRRLKLDERQVLESGREILVLPWLGDRALVSTALALATVGVKATAEGPALRVIDTDGAGLRRAATSLLDGPPPDPIAIARQLENTEVDKWDYVLDDDLAAEATAARLLDLDGAWAVLRSIVSGPGSERLRVPPAGSPSDEFAASPFDAIEFCVIDVETTGVRADLGDRIVEIALLRLRGDGTVLDEWTTLVNPQREIDAVEVHGIETRDLTRAPTFAEIAGDVLHRISDAVLVGHNVGFDQEFLLSELDRAGLEPPALQMLCTLGLVARLVPTAKDLRLGPCCDRIGYALGTAHRAQADARAAAALLHHYLSLAAELGIATIEQLGGTSIDRR